MNKHTKEIFADYEYMLKKFRKNDYIKKMELFKSKWNDTIAADIENADYNEVTSDFVEQVIKLYSRFGRLSKTKKMDLGLFMIYFVFPGIELTGKEAANEFCDVLLGTWNEKMGTNIEYLGYEEILDGFNDKMFGIF